MLQRTELAPCKLEGTEGARLLLPMRGAGVGVGDGVGACLGFAGCRGGGFGDGSACNAVGGG